MDEESKAIAAGVPGMILPGGAKRPFARLNALLAKLFIDRRGKLIKQLYFVFEGQTLEVSADDEFFTVDRIHLRRLETPPAVDAEWVDLTNSPDLSHLVGLDLAAVRWELLAGDIDQFIVLEFQAHKQHTGAADAAITITGDDFHLTVFKGAPLFPDLIFDADTQTCRSR